MKKLAVLSCAALLVAALAAPGLAFQEYPSLEIAPYVGYVAYDGDMTSYMSNLNFGFRVDLRTIAALGFQFNYSRSKILGDFPGQPFGKDDYIERVQLNFTRDLRLQSGIYFYGFAGVGSFNRHSAALYDNDPSVQAGLGFRRNLFGPLYLRGDIGWTGAFLKDYDPDGAYGDRTLTHHLDGALTLSFLFDN